MQENNLFVSHPMQVQKEWIDYNGHLNMAYYNVLFEMGSEQFFAELGLGPDYAATRSLTIYTAEVHVCYIRELHLGDLVTASLQLIDLDDKRVHIYQELRHVDGWLSATCENLSLHIDMTGPKVTPFPPDIAERLLQAASAHAHLPRPERVGRHVAIRRR